MAAAGGAAEGGGGRDGVPREGGAVGSPRPRGHANASPEHGATTPKSEALSALALPPVRDEAILFGFGQNAYGELGLEDTSSRSTPTMVGFARELCVTQIVAGNEHSAFVCDDGTCYSVGYNESGQCGLGHTSRVSRFTRVDAFAGRDIHRLFSSNGCEHICFVGRDGSLWTCGFNNRGQCGVHGTSTLPLPVRVELPEAVRVRSVACSYHHSCLVTDTGVVYSFGRNDFGQLGLGGTDDTSAPCRITALEGRPVASVACGQYHTVFALEDGTVLACGKNDYGQLGVDLAGPVTVPTELRREAFLGRGVVQVACGYYHSLALADDGSVFSFGRNDFGSLGLGMRVHQRLPHLVHGLGAHTIQAIACGCYHSMALSEEGVLFAFGRNNHGQLGLGHVEDTPAPHIVSGFSDFRVIQVAAGFYHTMVLALRRGVEAEAVPSARVGEALARDMRGLLNNEKLSDVTFIVEGRPLHAHRCILSVRCEPLDSMLDGGMREAQQREVVLEDVRFDAFLSFLEYLYTDHVEALASPSFSVDAALDLLTIADRFLVEHLKRLCEVAIQRTISVDNVATMLEVADSRNASALRARCFDFILSNFGRVIATKAFTELPQPLLREVLLEASRRRPFLRG